MDCLALAVSQVEQSTFVPSVTQDCSLSRSSSCSSTATVAELKRRCRNVGFSVSGTKHELAARLGSSSSPPKVEPQCFRLTQLPVHHGGPRQGSLRVTTRHAGEKRRNAARVDLLDPVVQNNVRRRVCRVVPCAAPFAISVVRHDYVFSSANSRRSLEPRPICDVCGDPAEVYELDESSCSLHDHLLANGLDPLAVIKSQFEHQQRQKGPPLLRVCRKGCITYELQEHMPSPKVEPEN